MENETSKQRGENSIEETVIHHGGPNGYTIRCLSAVPEEVEALLAEIAAAEQALAGN
jgi:hypothetical protein